MDWASKAPMLTTRGQSDKARLGVENRACWRDSSMERLR